MLSSESFFVCLIHHKSQLSRQKTISKLNKTMKITQKNLSLIEDRLGEMEVELTIKDITKTQYNKISNQRPISLNERTVDGQRRKRYTTKATTMHISGHKAMSYQYFI